MFRNNHKPLTNYGMINLKNKLKIKNFKEVFIRDTLSNKTNKIKCGIVN